jgi:hypothetical protein
MDNIIDKTKKAGEKFNGLRGSPPRNFTEFYFL